MDQKLKQRLVGAGVLVVLGIIIIPELIKDPANQDNPDILKSATRSEPPSAKDTLAVSLPAAKPAAPETAPKTAEPASPPPAVAAVPEPATARQEKQAAGAPVEVKPHQEPLQPDTITQPAATAQEAPAVKAKPPASPETRTATAVPPAAKKPESSKSSGSPKETRVAKTAVSASPKGTEPVKSSAPPKDSRSNQNSNTGSAKKEPSKVTPAEPAEAPKIDFVSRPATSSPPAPASSRPNWTVQAGSFADREKAIQLRAKLRDQQLPATLESVTLNDRTMYRVRVGSQTSRTESERVLTRMEQQLGVTGQIMVGDK